MPPPVRNAAATREAILIAAKQRFLRDSYDAVGLREIAGDVGVDVSLIGRYFGSKEQLFRDVLRHGKARLDDQALSADELPAYMASIALPEGGEGDCGNIERLQILLRSASSAKASQIVHNAFHEDVLAPIAAILPGEDAEMRATMAMSLLTGTTIMRAIMGTDVLCECDLGSVRAELESLLRAALSGVPERELLPKAAE
jgi:AcrR family transcriptional regulator